MDNHLEILHQVFAYLEFVPMEVMFDPNSRTFHMMGLSPSFYEVDLDKKDPPFMRIKANLAELTGPKTAYSLLSVEVKQVNYRDGQPIRLVVLTDTTEIVLGE